MNYHYNVLWLDDEPIKALEQIREVNPSIYFDKVEYIDVCERRLESQSEKYHAVILDANGVSSDSPEKDANKSGFLRLVHNVIDHHIPLYIYSGQLLRASDGDSADIVLEELHRLGLKENIFYKSGGPYDLIDKIVRDLDEKYQYYAGHKHYLSFFANGWIPSKYKSEFFDPIMEYYYRKDYNSAHGNHMRNITEQMLDKINEEFKVATNIKKYDSGRFSIIAQRIKSTKLDYSQTISGPLLHMIDVTNAKSHIAMPEEERKLYFESDFSTFFIVANWFYKIMNSTENSHDINVNDNSEPEYGTLSNVAQKTENKLKIQTHEDERTGVPIDNINEEEGKIYSEIKVEIPLRCKNYKKIEITGIIPNKYPDKAKWYAICRESK